MSLRVDRVLTYSRVSTSDKGQNPAVQVEELRRYCQARDWKIVEEVIDHGFTGSSDNRPGLRKLMQMVVSREVDAVIVVKMDRLFRSLKHLITTLDEFEALGVCFVATKDSVDYTTPSGRLFVQVLGSLAEFERSLIRERTMLGLAHAVANGTKLGRPLESDYDELVRLRSQGLSYREIERRTGCSSGAINRAVQAASKSPTGDGEKSAAKTEVESD